jgi:hypothetical protein
MMQRAVTAIVLCVVAQAAAAQCVAAPASAEATPVVHATTAVKQNTQSTARTGGELIKAAAAGTRDDAPPVAHSTMSARAERDDDHPHRGSTAMLLAALALMSGIALRRYGSREV